MPTLARVVLAAVLAVTAVAAPGRARACSLVRVDMFTRADRAGAIVLGTVQGNVVRVDRMIAGPPLTQIPLTRVVVRPPGPDSRPGRTGDCRLVLVDGEQLVGFANERGLGDAIHLAEPHEHRGAPAAEHARVLGAWRSATDDRARLAVLLGEMRAQSVYAEEATQRLVIDPALRAALDDRDRATLAAHVGLHPTGLTLIAAIGMREAVPRLIEALDPDRMHDGIAVALERLTNHHVDVPRARLAATWRAWWRAHRRETHARWLARGFAERRIVARVSERASLAEVARTAPDLLSRWTALARCAQLGATEIDLDRVSRTRSITDGEWLAQAYRCAPPP